MGGAGAPIFGSGKPAANANAGSSGNAGGAGDDDIAADGAADDSEHDPHFEPIIPLPELVQVKTGEEEEETLFKFRAKVFRFHPETKEWKERGLGDIKILKHKQKQTFRVLQRRDQIHKIACNHLISTDMELKPLSSSETALCWYAMDYAEEEAKMEHLAVRFKTADTKNEFQKVFEECQAKLRQSKDSAEETGATSTAAKTDASEDEDEEDSVMFANECRLYETVEGVEKLIGRVEIQMLYDSEVNGARIVAHKDDQEEACNHLIAMQTEMDVVQEECSWSALDFTVDPPNYRSFVAVFDSEDTMKDFIKCFEEGKQLAVNDDDYYDEDEEGGEHDDDDNYA